MEGNLWIKEIHVNKTKGHRMGDDDWYESFTDNVGRLFRSLRKEYGSARNMYAEAKNGEHYQVGWVFSKTRQYSDCKDKYVHEVWVEVSTTKPVKTTIVDNLTHPF